VSVEACVHGVLPRQGATERNQRMATRMQGESTQDLVASELLDLRHALHSLLAVKPVRQHTSAQQ
jgi:hypothetical protein